MSVRGRLMSAAVVSGVAWLLSRPATRAIGTTLLRTAGGTSGWLVVTVNRPLDELSGDGQLPEPIVQLNDVAEVRVRPAPGDRGTELGLRPLAAPPLGMAGLVSRLRGDDPRQRLRRALRDAKSLLETGEILQPEEPATEPTPAGRALDFVLSRAGGEGRL